MSDTDFTFEVVSIPTTEVFKHQERDSREGVPKTEKIELEDPPAA